MLRIAICDDEPAVLSLLEEGVCAWAKERREKVEISFCENAQQFLFQEEDKEPADILLLDIEMPGMNGIDLAKKLRAGKETMQIIFITGFAGYALEGYEVDAVSYLVKPVRQEALSSSLTRALERCRRQEPVLFVETFEGRIRVKISGISYLESMGHEVFIHMTEGAGTIRSRESLTGLQKRLEEGSIQAGMFFKKPHRSYLVSIADVLRISRKELEMAGDGGHIPIARGKWEELNTAWLSYYRNRQGF